MKYDEGYFFITKQGDYCEIIKRVSDDEIYIMVSCDEDFLVSCCMKVNISNIRAKSLKNPLRPTVHKRGYRGVGKYKTMENGKQTKTYKTWLAMFTRCYDENARCYNENYKDCIVSEEWWNFQNFALWYEQNYYDIEEEQMHLEKDFLVKGNKIYGPEYCVFCPRSINSMLTTNKSRRGDSPIGTSYDSRDRKYYVRVQDGHGNSHSLGSYSNSYDAFKVYKEKKEYYIKCMADEYKEKIPDKLYNAMYNYKVEIND